MSPISFCVEAKPAVNWLSNPSQREMQPASFSGLLILLDKNEINLLLVWQKQKRVRMLV